MVCFKWIWLFPFVTISCYDYYYGYWFLLVYWHFNFFLFHFSPGIFVVVFIWNKSIFNTEHNKVKWNRVKHITRISLSKKCSEKQNKNNDSIIRGEKKKHQQHTQNILLLILWYTFSDQQRTNNIGLHNNRNDIKHDCIYTQQIYYMCVYSQKKKCIQYTNYSFILNQIPFVVLLQQSKCCCCSVFVFTYFSLYFPCA